MAKKKIVIIKRKKKRRYAIVRVHKNRSSGQLLCTIPRKSKVKKGDYLRIDLNKL